MVMRAGHAVVDITPPLGIEMGGFHKAPGDERRIVGIRSKTEARALALEIGEAKLVIISLDLCALSLESTRRVQEAAAKRTGVPPNHVCLTATHTHSMPTFFPLLQWGAVDEAYQAQVETKAVDLAVQAMADLADADVYLGRAAVEGGNFNRTVPEWKVTAEYNESSTDADRWLDTDLHVLQFLRESAKGNIVWYHFSAHPVCHADDQAGPDWPGVVAERLEEVFGMRPGLLQGHIGDVNPGDGTPWRGDLEETSSAVATALYHASTHASLMNLDRVVVKSAMVKLPFDYVRFNQELEMYREHPEKCTEGTWVDAGFSKAWYEAVKNWDQTQPHLETSVTAVHLGDVALLFHAGELYSCYGLQLRRDSPVPHTLCIGYTGTFAGYLPDPTAYEKLEYSAIVVPKILTLPPFTPEVGRHFTEQCTALLTGFA